MVFKNITIIIPVFNDEEVLKELQSRLQIMLNENHYQYKIIFIDDGSTDNSWNIITELQNNDSNICGLKLLRNFGQQNAIAAGLDYAEGDVVVIMDSDLQDKPEDIPKLISVLEENDASMAIAKWIRRKDSFCKKFVSKLFYSVSQKITNLHYELGLGVFRAIRGEVVEELKKYNEKTSTPISLLYWIGVDYVTVPLERDARFAGKSGYNLHKMLKLSMDRIFSFSMFPIRASIYSGIIISLLSFTLAIIFIIRRIMKLVAPGWTSIVVIVLFLFGINFIFLGVIGEYLGRVFIETRQRPKYIVKSVVGDICKKL
jgi:dolichol-phosphate mannosyltransferase